MKNASPLLTFFHIIVRRACSAAEHRCGVAYHCSTSLLLFYEFHFIGGKNINYKIILEREVSAWPDNTYIKFCFWQFCHSVSAPVSHSTCFCQFCLSISKCIDSFSNESIHLYLYYRYQAMGDSVTLRRGEPNDILGGFNGNGTKRKWETC